MEKETKERQSNYRTISSFFNCLVFVGMMVVSLIWDYRIINCDAKILCNVTEGYLNEVFSAICTVAVLGNALLSLLFSSSDGKIRGITYRDILHYSSFGTQMLSTIILTTISILIAVFAYAKSLYTTLTFCLTADAILILISSIQLWNLLANREKQILIVKEILADRSSGRYDVFLDNWFQELEHSLTANYESNIQDFSAILSSLLDEDSDSKPIAQSVSGHLFPLFCTACEKIGFMDAYLLISRINGLVKDGVTSPSTIAKKYIESMTYQERVYIHNEALPNILKSISEDEQHFQDWEKTELMYAIFLTVYENTHLDQKAKRQILSSIFDVFCDLSSKRGGAEKKEVLLVIVKRFVLLNEQESERAMLFELITLYLISNKQFNRDSCYISAVGEIFRAFYFYIYYETDTLAKEYREKLLTLFLRENHSRDVTAISFAYIVKKNLKKILLWAMEDAVTFMSRRRLFWDYFNPLTYSKNIIWSEQALIQFAFDLYMLNGPVHISPIAAIIDSDQFTDLQKITMCRTISEAFTDAQLSGAALDRISKMDSLLRIPYHSNSNLEKSTRNYILDTFSKIKTAYNQKTAALLSPAEDNISKLVCERLQKKNGSDSHGIELVSGLPVHPIYHYRLEPILVENDEHRESYAVSRVCSTVLEIVNLIISRKLDKIKIDFGIEGIQILLDQLQSDDYKYCNYLHINDWGIAETVKDAEAFQSLAKVISSLRYDRASEINQSVFLKGDAVSYQLEVHYFLQNASSEECANFINSHRITEGTYLIGGIPYDYSRAMQYVRNNYMRETVDLDIHVAVDSNSGFIVDY